MPLSTAAAADAQFPASRLPRSHQASAGISVELRVFFLLFLFLSLPATARRSSSPSSSLICFGAWCSHLFLPSGSLFPLLISASLTSRNMQFLKLAAALAALVSATLALEHGSCKTHELTFPSELGCVLTGSQMSCLVAWLWPNVSVSRFSRRCLKLTCARDADPHWR